MSIFNALEFDGINSLDYGIYITGEAVFNSPQRSVEAVTVPGRNGDVLLDLGRYENIEVTYHAGVFGVDQSEFASKIRTFRNMLASKIGYKRITDTYNPTEYRLGSFIAPVDVTPTSMNRAGEFDIVFNCKPQRFLMDGESAIEVTDGQQLYNPTPFESQPLLAVYGHGDINLGGQSISIGDVEIGDIQIYNGRTSGSSSFSFGFNANKLNEGDIITVPGLKVEWSFTLKSTYDSGYTVSSFTPSSPVGLSVQNASITGARTAYLSFVADDIQVAYATSGSMSTLLDASLSMAYSIKKGSTTSSYTQSFTLKLYYFPSNDSLQWSITPQSSANIFDFTRVSTVAPITAYSTKSALAQPVYIDFEIGEAYGYISGELTSLDNVLTLPSDLPTLAPGSNLIEFDNTITAMAINPRWWIL